MIITDLKKIYKLGETLKNQLYHSQFSCRFQTVSFEKCKCDEFRVITNKQCYMVKQGKELFSDCLINYFKKTITIPNNLQLIKM